eukprot:259131_1
MHLLKRHGIAFFVTLICVAPSIKATEQLPKLKQKLHELVKRQFNRYPDNYTANDFAHTTELPLSFHDEVYKLQHEIQALEGENNSSFILPSELQLKPGDIVRVGALRNQSDQEMQEIVTQMRHSYGIVMNHEHGVSQRNTYLHRFEFRIQWLFNDTVCAKIKGKYLRRMIPIVVHNESIDATLLIRDPLKVVMPLQFDIKLKQLIENGECTGVVYQHLLWSVPTRQYLQSLKAGKINVTDLLVELPLRCDDVFYRAALTDLEMMKMQAKRAFKLTQTEFSKSMQVLTRVLGNIYRFYLDHYYDIMKGRVPYRAKINEIIGEGFKSELGDKGFNKLRGCDAFWKKFIELLSGWVDRVIEKTIMNSHCKPKTREMDDMIAADIVEHYFLGGQRHEQMKSFHVIPDNEHQQLRLLKQYLARELRKADSAIEDAEALASSLIKRV